MGAHLVNGYIFLDVAAANADSGYLPQYRLLDPTNPGKVCVVFDCANHKVGHSLMANY